MPAFARKTLRPSPLGFQEKPRRGCHIFLSDGIFPFEGNSWPFDRLADEARVEDLIGRRDRIGLDLRFPAQAVLHVQVRA